MDRYTVILVEGFLCFAVLLVQSSGKMMNDFGFQINLYFLCDAYWYDCAIMCV